MTSETEIIIRELIALRKTPRVYGKNLERAKQLLIRLKKLGYSAEKIEEMTGGLWKSSVSKQYTKGIRLGDTHEPATLKPLAEMTSRGLTLDQVEVANSIRRILDISGSSLEEISQFIAKGRNSGLGVENLVAMMTQIRKSGIPLGEFENLFSYKKELEQRHIDPQKMSTILELSDKLGGFDKIAEMINQYGNLRSLRSDRDKMFAEKKRLELQVNQLADHCERLKEEKTAVEKPLELYRRLQKQGFSEEALLTLTQVAMKYGGTSSVLHGLNMYANKFDMAVYVQQMELKQKAAEKNLLELEAKYRSFSHITAICDKLLQHKFSIEDIERLYNLAKKFGEPFQIMKAIDYYANLSEIRKRAGSLNARKVELEGQVRELETKHRMIAAQLTEIGHQVERRINALFLVLDKAVEKGSESISTTFASEAKRLSLLVDKYARTASEAAVLQDELMTAKIIKTVTQHPYAVQNHVPLQYASTFLELAAMILRAKGVNPIAVNGGNIGVLELIELVLSKLGSTKSSQGDTTDIGKITSNYILPRK